MLEIATEVYYSVELPRFDDMLQNVGAREIFWHPDGEWMFITEGGGPALRHIYISDMLGERIRYLTHGLPARSLYGWMPK